MRVGIGFDVHPLVEGKPLKIGGVTIEYHKGLDGHSDGDVLLHALVDALFGAVGLGDIGDHFPDTDEAYKDIASIELVEKTMQLVAKEGFVVENVDSIVFAEEPKLAPYKDEIRTALARVLDITPFHVNVKAKTMEKLGFIGAGEAIASEVIVTVKQLK